MGKEVNNLSLNHTHPKKVFSCLNPRKEEWNLEGPTFVRLLSQPKIEITTDPSGKLKKTSPTKTFWGKIFICSPARCNRGESWRSTRWLAWLLKQDLRTSAGATIKKCWSTMAIYNRLSVSLSSYNKLSKVLTFKNKISLLYQYSTSIRVKT